ncbi:hypothetical protein CDL15_Pgr008015 [Punica granatum]|uniref:Uncharacterized protein n=1 Tax=Punica granatum TaxID=22663 RepID=A0A218VS16_PUNGR|nr:hypothetical protein CDL15_Pgr008015 [Punica granatum]
MFVVPDEINLLPDIAEEVVDSALAKLRGAVEPVGAEDAYLELHGAAARSWVEPVEEGVVLEVDQGQVAAVVHEQQGMELLRPHDYEAWTGYEAEQMWSSLQIKEASTRTHGDLEADG